jgi:hypothetical protein
MKGHKNGFRYAKLVDIRGGEDCWNWLGCIHKNTGYGKKQWFGETWLAHRWVWTMLCGTIPHNMTINHKCSNRACVNPTHLEVVSQTDNCRHGKGTKLTKEQAALIKAAGPQRRWGDGARLARHYGVSGALIHDIWAGRAWRDI